MTEDTPEPGHNGAEKAHMYLETLRARMDPRQFHALSDALRNITDLLTGKPPNNDPDRKTAHSALTPEVQREVLTIMAIVTTGRMDHHLVELPGPDGKPMWAAVEPETARDPEEMRKIHTRMLRWTADDHAATDGAPNRIARTGGPEDPD